MDSKIILFLWIVGVGLLTFSFWRMLFQEGKPTNVPPKEGNIILFGDSLAEGIGAGPGNDLASQLFKSTGELVINAGRSGDTTSSALGRLGRDVLSQNPRLVVILLGGNDAIQGISAEEVQDNLFEIITKIQGKGAAVLLLGVRGGIIGDPYGEVFESVARERKIDYVPDVLNGILGGADLMSDPIHPNDKGYARVADRVGPILVEMLQR